MGVLRLFAYIYKKYPSCIIPICKRKEIPACTDIKVISHSFELDLNALIHPICQKMYGYSTNTNKSYGKPQLLKNKLKKKIIPNEKDVFQKILEEMENLCKIVNPSKTIVICLDGVAGLSKMCQQRQRRFRSTAEKKISDNSCTFDSNCITTGSLFMENFSEYLSLFIENRMKLDDWWKSRTVIFSNHKVAGEGESKIMQYVKVNNTKNHCIYSPDGDLIMYTLGIIEKNNMYILRENIYDNVDSKYFIIDVQKLKDSLLTTIEWKNEKNIFNKTYACWDFIFVTFMLGNDFLPHSPSLEISNSGLDVLIELCSKCCYEYGHLVYWNDELKTQCINKKTLKKMLEELSSQEIKRLENKASKRIQYPDTLLNSCVQNKKLDFEKYKNLYYKRNFEKDFKIQDVCKLYFSTLQFIIRYYMNGMPDWHYCYPYHYAPFITDLLKYFDTFDSNVEFTLNSPLSCYEQLLAVLPKKSCSLLPKPLQTLMETNSCIQEYFPINIEMDCEGVQQDYEFKVLINFVNVNSIKKAYESKKHLLTIEEVERNKFGKILKYVFLDNKLSKTTLDIK